MVKSIVVTASGGSCDAIVSKRPARHEQTKRGAGQRKDDRLEQQLADQLRAAGADRQPHRHLAGASCAAHEQQIGDVRAGNQQHHARDAKEQHQRRGRFLGQLSSGRWSRSASVIRLRPKPRHRLLAHPPLQRRLRRR